MLVTLVVCGLLLCAAFVITLRFLRWNFKGVCGLQSIDILDMTIDERRCSSKGEQGESGDALAP
ncbi:hypothetical protein DIPPA_14785 [Diplonema papillatum]|nr:hypothetical protein DIPPA_14785 [Diplonema papillatum]